MKTRRTSVLAIVVAGLFSGATTPARADYSFDFNGGNDNGLTRYDPLATFGSGATFTFPNGGYRLSSNPSANLAALGPARVGSYQATQSFANFRVSVDVVQWDTKLDQDLGLAARLSNIGLGTSNGYYLHYDPLPGSSQAELVLQRIDGEQNDSSIATVLLPPIASQPGFRLVFTGIGSTLTGQVFALNDLNHALASVTLVDSTYQSGFAGLLSTGFAAGPNTNVDVTYDNFTAAAVPEPSSGVLLTCGVVGLVVLARKRQLGRPSGATGCP